MRGSIDDNDILLGCWYTDGGGSIMGILEGEGEGEANEIESLYMNVYTKALSSAHLSSPGDVREASFYEIDYHVTLHHAMVLLQSYHSIITVLLQYSKRLRLQMLRFDLRSRLQHE